MKIFYTDHFVLPLPEGHRFPMQKYSLLRQRVMQAGLSGGEALREPHAATDEEIRRAHDAGYLQRVVSGELKPAEARQIGFPWTPQMVERSRRSAGATIEACRAALEEGIGVNLAGADPYRDDRFGRLALSKEGLRTRDSLVLDLCRTACLPAGRDRDGGRLCQENFRYGGHSLLHRRGRRAFPARCATIPRPFLASNALTRPREAQVISVAAAFRHIAL